MEVAVESAVLPKVLSPLLSTGLSVSSAFACYTHFSLSIGSLSAHSLLSIGSSFAAKVYKKAFGLVETPDQDKSLFSKFQALTWVTDTLHSRTIHSFLGRAHTFGDTIGTLLTLLDQVGQDNFDIRSEFRDNGVNVHY